MGGCDLILSALDEDAHVSTLMELLKLREIQRKHCNVPKQTADWGSDAL